MTTNGAGVTSWQSGGSGSSSTESAFLAWPTSDQVMMNATTIPVANYFELYDANNDFDPATCTFTAPSNGLYNFKFKATINAGANLDEKTFFFRYYKNNTSLVAQANLKYWTETGWAHTLLNSEDIYLSAGDTINLEIEQVSGATISINGSSAITSKFSGHKIN